MYESLKNRIAALEEEEVLEEEEERRFGMPEFLVRRSTISDCLSLAEEAHKSVKGMEENAIHAKYIELVGSCNCTLSLQPIRALVCGIQALGAGSCKGKAEAV